MNELEENHYTITDDELIISNSKRFVWKKMHEVSNLHLDLAQLYRSKSNDRKRILLLWNAIEYKEAELIELGVAVG
jgi:hypothetical protein